jgi:hypothetical protein
MTVWLYAMGMGLDVSKFVSQKNGAQMLPHLVLYQGFNLMPLLASAFQYFRTSVHGVRSQALTAHSAMQLSWE